jgi:hypothetical protein
MAYKREAAAEARWRKFQIQEPRMRALFLILALSGGAAVAQIPPAVAEPSPPMVPAVRPPLGAASRAARHEDFARERALRTAERAEDRADSDRKQQDSGRRQRRTDR